MSAKPSNPAIVTPDNESAARLRTDESEREAERERRVADAMQWAMEANADLLSRLANR